MVENAIAALVSVIVSQFVAAGDHEKRRLHCPRCLVTPDLSNARAADRAGSAPQESGELPQVFDDRVGTGEFAGPVSAAAV